MNRSQVPDISISLPQFNLVCKSYPFLIYDPSFLAIFIFFLLRLSLSFLTHNMFSVSVSVRFDDISVRFDDIVPVAICSRFSPHKCVKSNASVPILKASVVQGIESNELLSRHRDHRCLRDFRMTYDLRPFASTPTRTLKTCFSFQSDCRSGYCLVPSSLPHNNNRITMNPE